MNEKLEKLKRAIEDALKNRLFFFNGIEIEITSIHSDIDIYEYYPLGKVDMGNLEDCIGGLFRISVRIKSQSDVGACEKCHQFERIEFEVTSYEGNLFNVEIKTIN